MNWYMEVLRKYVDFSGRARRKELWMFALISFGISVVLGIIGAVIKTDLLANLYGLAVLLPSIAVGVRRLHDTGRSGFWLLVGLIPILGWIVLLVFYILPGNPGPNEYGPDPKDDYPGSAYPV